MRTLLLTILLLCTPFAHSNTIKSAKIETYNKALLASTVKLNPKPAPIKKKIRNLYPIFVPKKPSLNGNFSRQLSYKNSQKKVIVRSDNQ